MYVLIKSGSVSKYPYSVSELKKDNPNDTFVYPYENLGAYGVYEVEQVQTPSCNYQTQKVSEDTPALIENVWTQVWKIEEKTEEEKTQHRDNENGLKREHRNNALKDTDWWAVSDRTMTDEQKKYRQDLRDLPTHANWPYLENEDWPTKPSV
tara:strand:+ start:1622 stop:2077 length:456 start_codon:yes stop_codon:yes gene_type:complete